MGKITAEEIYKETREKMINKIIKMDLKGKEEVNIETPYRRSRITLGDYVTLDFVYR